MTKDERNAVDVGFPTVSKVVYTSAKMKVTVRSPNRIVACCAPALKKQILFNRTILSRVYMGLVSYSEAILVGGNPLK